MIDNKAFRIMKTKFDSNSKYEEALNKGCYEGDTAEVKEKHIQTMLDCFAGKVNDLIQPMDALDVFIKKHVEYEHDFKRNMK